MVSNKIIGLIKSFKKEIKLSLGITSIITLLLLYFVWNNTSISNLIIATVYSLILYFLFFTVGSPAVKKRLNELISNDIKEAILFPTFLIIIYYLYIIINGGNPFKGTVFLFPFLIYFPVIIFIARKNYSNNIDWIDFFTLVIFLLPTTLIKFEPTTGIPVSGGGFDSVYRLVIILTAVYSFVVIRGIKDVGFYPIVKWKYLGITLLTWIIFYSVALLIAFPLNFMKFVGHESYNADLLMNIVRKIVTVFLHTAIFEELFFRGILQNMLSKRISQSNNWKIFWKWGLFLLFILSLITGYGMKGSFNWLPALVTILLFVGAYFIEQKKLNDIGKYTALVITSIIFGLVHYHAGSIVFVALASIGGWAYGYTYLKTKNVFYSALLHSLINNTAFILGIELLK